MRSEFESADEALVIAEEIEKNFSLMRLALINAVDAVESKYKAADAGISSVVAMVFNAYE